MERDGEIVGLRYPTNGRFCDNHECCGMSAVVGTLVQIQLAIVEVEGEPQEAIKAVSLEPEGEVHYERCVIGFLRYLADPQRYQSPLHCGTMP